MNTTKTATIQLPPLSHREAIHLHKVICDLGIIVNAYYQLDDDNFNREHNGDLEQPPSAPIDDPLPF